MRSADKLTSTGHNLIESALNMQLRMLRSDILQLDRHLFFGHNVGA